MCLGDAFIDEKMSWFDDLDEPGPRSVSIVDMSLPPAQERIIGRTRNAWAKRQGVTALLAQQLDTQHPIMNVKDVIPCERCPSEYADLISLPADLLSACQQMPYPAKDVNLKNAIQPNLSIDRAFHRTPGIGDVPDGRPRNVVVLTSIVRIAATAYCGCPCQKRHVPDGCRLQRV